MVIFNDQGFRLCGARKKKEKKEKKTRCRNNEVVNVCSRFVKVVKKITVVDFLELKGQITGEVLGLKTIKRGEE